MTEYLHYSDGNRWMRLLPTVGTAMLAIILASFIVDVQHIRELRKPASDTGAGDTGMGLRVASKPQQVDVFWKHDSAAIRDAEKGNIRITDGDLTEVIPFDSQQLQDGSLVYQPRTNDVAIRLEVTQHDGRRTAESVRVVATP